MSRRKYKKKKEETKVNIEKVNIEIDYDKLAESIVSAQVILNKEQAANNGAKANKVSNFFAIIICVVFGLLGFFSALMAISGVITLFQYLPKSIWTNSDAIINSINQILIYIILIIIFGVFVFLSFSSIVEIRKEKDRNYIVSVFSALTSLAALIVAFIALIK